MKTFRRILLIVVFVGALLAAIAYVDGTTLPLLHTASVSGTIAAPPDKVFAIIAAPANGASWRHNVKSVTMLAPQPAASGLEDHWVENLSNGHSMQFLAVATDPPNRREVKLDDPSAAYGGSWIYELSPGPKPNTTTLTITEAGFIRPPFYRFVMTHVVGLTSNLDTYLVDVQKAFPGTA
jgi:uncharacterized protein YndB with AHSA1/START domain